MFLVKSDNAIRILGAYQDYDKEQSRHIFEGIEISETVIDESQCDEITGRIEGCLKTM